MLSWLPTNDGGSYRQKESGQDFQGGEGAVAQQQAARIEELAGCYRVGERVGTVLYRLHRVIVLWLPCVEVQLLAPSPAGHTRRG